MPPLNINVKMTMDDSDFTKKMASAEGKMKNFSSGIDKVGKSADDVGSTLAAAIPVALIEEAIRRTGEWALSLQRASDKLGITTTQTQQLKELFKRSGLNESDVTAYFEKLNSAATDALAGNSQLSTSLQRLGLQYKDLKNMPTIDMFEKIMGSKDLKNKGLFIEKVFGKSEIRNVENLSNQFTGGGQKFGGTLSDYSEMAQLKTVDKEAVSAMAESWQVVLKNMTSLFVAVSPLLVKALQVAAGLTEIVDAIVRSIPGIKKKLPLTDEEKAAPAVKKDSIGKKMLNMTSKGSGYLVGVGAGLIKSGTSIVDLASFGKLNTTDAMEEYFNAYGPYKNMTGVEKAGSQLTGDALEMVIGGGAGTGLKYAGKAAQMVKGGKKVGTLLEKVGKSKELSGVLKQGAFGVEGLAARSEAAAAEKIIVPVTPKEIAQMSKQGNISEKTVMAIMGARAEKAAEQTRRIKAVAAADRIERVTSFASGIGGVIKGASQVGEAGKAATSGIFPGTASSAVDRGPTAMGLTMGNMVGSSGGPNLRFGGMYGADMQSRMTILTQDMRDFLLQIVQNTAALRGSTATNAKSQPITEMH
jgi:hypothetical protein